MCPFHYITLFSVHQIWEGGIVITDDGKKDMVLCPARWFSFQLDDDFGCVINSAVRYAIGRHTYMPGVVCNFVRKYMDVLDTRINYAFIA